MEIYALEIQMHNEMRNFKKLKVGCARFIEQPRVLTLREGNIQCYERDKVRYSTSTHTWSN